MTLAAQINANNPLKTPETHLGEWSVSELIFPDAIDKVLVLRRGFFSTVPIYFVNALRHTRPNKPPHPSGKSRNPLAEWSVLELKSPGASNEVLVLMGGFFFTGSIYFVNTL